MPSDFVCCSQCPECIVEGQWAPDGNLVVPCERCCEESPISYSNEVVGHHHPSLRPAQVRQWYFTWGVVLPMDGDTVWGDLF